MYTDFDHMPPHSRVWIYQADRVLTQDEVAQLHAQIKTFCDGWEAHKQPVKAYGAVLHNLFLLLMADNDFHEVSGCSIDSSVAFVRSAGEALGVDFFNRLNIAAFSNDQWQLFPLASFKQLMAEGEVKPTDRVFNYQIATKEQLQRSFSVPVSESWLAKFLPQEV